MIAIVDYGMGNIASVSKALRHIGCKVLVTADPHEISRADALVLPGVGEMAEAMKNLKKLKLIEPIKEFIEEGKPFLGICLGYQMLFQTSDEGIKTGGSTTIGLGVIRGKVIKIQEMPFIKIPHMGWNKLNVKNSDYLAGGEYVYFIHSYYPRPEDRSIITSHTKHGLRFPTSIEKNNIFGVQFHPEKSGEAGLNILNNWVDKNKLSEGLNGKHFI